MYSKQEASILNQQFWTSFGQYLAPILSAEGEKINWINYKTGIKDIRFIMQADNRQAKIAITFLHKDVATQQLYFEKLAVFKKAFHQISGETWQWKLHTTDGFGRTISEITTTMQPVNLLNKADWPAIISFLKPRIIALDKFWCEYKYALE
jgi:hypothetical protein